MSLILFKYKPTCKVQVKIIPSNLSLLYNVVLRLPYMYFSLPYMYFSAKNFIFKVLIKQYPYKCMYNISYFPPRFSSKRVFKISYVISFVFLKFFFRMKASLFLVLLPSQNKYTSRFLEESNYFKFNKQKYKHL